MTECASIVYQLLFAAFNIANMIMTRLLRKIRSLNDFEVVMNNVKNV